MTHFEGVAMTMAKDDTAVAHGCRHVGHGTQDHFGHGLLLDESADEDKQMGHHGRGHLNSLERDHFVGHSMQLDGRGDLDLERDHGGVAKVASAGTSAQESHFTHEYATLKE